MSSGTIPLEIDERIVDLLAEDDTNYLSVKACSLVCRSFLPLCRKHIFASIILNSLRPWPSTSPTTRKLERLLSKSPEIADYIRELDYTIVVDDLTSLSIQECLKRISRLQSLSLRHFIGRKLDWSSNNLRPVLLHLLHLPTLTHFKMFDINNFVASDLTPCVSLKKLDIGHYTTWAAANTFSETLPERSIHLNEFVGGSRNATAIMNICTARRPDGQPVIDFGSLAKITVIIEKDNDIEASQELFRRCKQLTDVNISFWDPRDICPSLSKMLRPSMQTLTHLDITIYVDHTDIDPLAGIPSELEEMRGKNIIKDIVIAVEVQTDEDCRRGDDWGRLDEVLTRSGWPALKQVLLTIDISTISRSDDELEVALRKLPETQFSRLSASESVSFKFEVTTTMVPRVDMT